MGLMRTTIDIPDAMYRRLKTRAAGEGRSAKALILQGVEHVLKAKSPAPRRRVRLPIIPSKHPGTMRIDNARIYDVISFP
jgi:plasmid stability protein